MHQHQFLSSIYYLNMIDFVHFINNIYLWTFSNGPSMWLLIACLLCGIFTTCTPWPYKNMGFRWPVLTITLFPYLLLFLSFLLSLICYSLLIIWIYDSLTWIMQPFKPHCPVISHKKPLWKTILSLCISSNLNCTLDRLSFCASVSPA